MYAKIKVTGMSCEHCVKRVTKAIEDVKGVKNVRVDLKTGLADFEKEDEVDLDRVIRAIKEAGYNAEYTQR